MVTPRATASWHAPRMAKVRLLLPSIFITLVCGGLAATGISVALVDGQTSGALHFATLLAVLGAIHYGRRLIVNSRALAGGE